MVRTNSTRTQAGLSSLRDYISAHDLGEGSRLPPERQLAVDLGVSRGQLRQLLASAEARGEIWRHVGKGTFVGSGRAATPDALASELARRSNPLEVLEARALMEPHLAALAAFRGTPEAGSELMATVRSGLAARDSRTSDRHGSRFHELIAEMAGNSLLKGLFDAVFRVRELNTWGKLKPEGAGVEDMADLWQQHARIADAIVKRDASEAETLMRQHIDQLQRTISRQEALFASMPVHQLAWHRGLADRSR